MTASGSGKSCGTGIITSLFKLFIDGKDLFIKQTAPNPLYYTKAPDGISQFIQLSQLSAIIKSDAKFSDFEPIKCHAGFTNGKYSFLVADYYDLPLLGAAANAQGRNSGKAIDMLLKLALIGESASAQQNLYDVRAGHAFFDEKASKAYLFDPYRDYSD
ncbi:MAG: hypothetical protein NT051_01750 [Candidatus Micrarchaeota archaeon]|nr:hypothetical protein [Candidatus Micrarchaeota archaeon]